MSERHQRTRIDNGLQPASTEPIERGWVCPDGSEHWWTEMILGDRTVDELCDRCGQLKSEVR